MWFSETQMNCTEQGVEILAATPFAARWIEQRFAAVIEDAATEAFGRTTSVSIQTATQQPPTQCEPSHHHPKPAARKKSSRRLRSFDEFVVGSCNRLAWSAAKQLLQDGTTISPLFVHGACGVGKTHLLQAICKEAAKTAPGRVRFVTAEQFTNEFIASSRAGDFQRFRNRYRKLDLLAIDDIHFVASKTKTQDELLHTLDSAGLRGARLALASDEDPQRIRRLNRALANRFVAGMVVEIGRPDRDTRHTIIERLLSNRGISMTPAAIERLSSQAVGSVREVEGAVTRITAAVQFLATEHKNIVGIDDVERVLRATPPTSHPIRMKDVVAITCKRLGVSVEDFLGNTRSTRVVFARSLAAYLGRSLTPLSFPELASALGRKNHSTVHAASRRIEKRLERTSNTEGTVRVGEEEITLRELLDQLTWAIRSSANE
jgi:chromosomal replication initiator protein